MRALMVASSEPTLEDQGITPEVAEQFQVSFGLEKSPATLAEWVEHTSRLFKDTDFQSQFNELCRTGPSRHEAHFNGGIYHYRGLFDTLLLPFIRGASTEIVVSSRSPVSNCVINLQLMPDTLSVSPSDAVMSFGVATDFVAPDYFEVPASIAYCRFNQYSNAFRDGVEHDTWAASTPGAVTMPLSLPVGFALAHRLLTALE